MARLARTQDHAVARAEIALREHVHALPEPAQIGRAVVAGRRADADEDQAGAAHGILRIARETHTTALEMLAQQFVDAHFTIRCDAALQAGDAFGHDIVADDVRTELGKTDGARHPNVSGSDDADGFSHVSAPLRVRTRRGEVTGS